MWTRPYRHIHIHTHIFICVYHCVSRVYWMQMCAGGKCAFVVLHLNKIGNLKINKFIFLSCEIVYDFACADCGEFGFFEQAYIFFFHSIYTLNRAIFRSKCRFSRADWKHPPLYGCFKNYGFIHYYRVNFAILPREEQQINPTITSIYSCYTRIYVSVCAYSLPPIICGGPRWT